MYDVSCDAHSGMSAQIIAASSPYVALTDSNGHFEIPHVVSGTYAVIVYAGAQPIEKTVEVTGSRTEIDVNANNIGNTYVFIGTPFFTSQSSPSTSPTRSLKRPTT